MVHRLQMAWRNHDWTTRWCSLWYRVRNVIRLRFMVQLLETWSSPEPSMIINIVLILHIPVIRTDILTEKNHWFLCIIWSYIASVFSSVNWQFVLNTLDIVPTLQGCHPTLLLQMVWMPEKTVALDLCTWIQFFHNHWKILISMWTDCK